MVSYTTGPLALPIPDDTDPMALMPQTIRDLAAALNLYEGTLRPLTLVERTTAYTIPDTTQTAIPWNLETVDTLAAYAGTPATDLIIPTGQAGLYTLGATVNFAGAGSADHLAVAIAVNGDFIGGNSAPGSSLAFNAQVSTARTWPLADGDHVKVVVRHNGGAGVSVGSATAGTNLLIARL